MVRWHHRLNGHESEQIPGDRMPVVLQSMGLQRVRVSDLTTHKYTHTHTHTVGVGALKQKATD